jgi:oligosaccharide repeat unit polymerase
MFRLRHILFMPAFYLLATFAPAYLMYVTDLIEYDESILLLHQIVIVTLLSSIVSMAMFYNSYKSLINDPSYPHVQKELQAKSVLNKWGIFILLIVGILGIAKYTLDYSRYLGGAGWFFILLFEDSGQVRTLQENVSSVGIQLSYFSWIAAFLTATNIGMGNSKKTGWLLILLVIILNIVFVDRTRPIWILFTCILSYFIAGFNRIKRGSIIRSITILGVTFITLFIFIGIWLGKITQEEDFTNKVPPVFQPAVLYATGSFAYFNQILINDPQVDYLPVRLTYPLQKIMASQKLVEEPPSQILEFYSLPPVTNVGTFLEPYYNDGGLPFTFLGIFIHTFLFNFLGLFFLRYPTRFSIIALSTLCFTNFIGFFTPKIASLPSWIFLGIGLVSALIASASLRYKENLKYEEELAE